MFNLLYTILYAIRPKKKENCAEEVGLAIVRSSFILDRLSTCQINHFLFSSVPPSLKSQMFLSLIILASESLWFRPEIWAVNLVERKEFVLFYSENYAKVELQVIRK